MPEIGEVSELISSYQALWRTCKGELSLYSEAVWSHIESNIDDAAKMRMILGAALIAAMTPHDLSPTSVGIRHAVTIPDALPVVFMQPGSHPQIKLLPEEARRIADTLYKAALDAERDGEMMMYLMNRLNGNMEAVLSFLADFDKFAKQKKGVGNATIQ